jgi:hypothetical protein
MDSCGLQSIVSQEDPDDPQAVDAHRRCSDRRPRDWRVRRSGWQEDCPAPDQAFVAGDVFRRHDDLDNDDREVEEHQHEEAGVEIAKIKEREEAAREISAVEVSPA